MLLLLGNKEFWFKTDFVFLKLFGILKLHKSWKINFYAIFDRLNKLYPSVCPFIKENFW